ncbi:MAG: YtxH domain-containing protein [Candidatus Saccharibacteria bacterium]
MSKIRKVAAGGFGLLAVGYALGILTAPQSGKQTRKHIKDKATNSVST